MLDFFTSVTESQSYNNFSMIILLKLLEEELLQ